MVSFQRWPVLNKNTSRRQLIIALDLIAACMVAQLLLDRWLAALVSEIQRSPIVVVLGLLPGRVQLSCLFTFGMVLLVAYRMNTGNRNQTDRGMFVLGCGAASGFAAHVLKIAFGRLPPDALLTDGRYGFHFFNGGDGFDSFPSSHAAMAVALAAAASAIWPARRWIFIGLAAVVAASRFIIGAHYLSDALLGSAVGLAIVVLMRALFDHLGIHLGLKNISEQ
jgi:membrane-associated phospholipid phosphatase